MPDTNARVTGAVPPELVTIVLYTAPTIPAGGVADNVRVGFTVRLTVLLLLVPGSIAVRVTWIGVLTVEGAVYVIVSPGDPEMVPQLDPEQLLPLTVHEGTADDLAVMLAAWPASRMITEAESVPIPVPAYPPAPHPEVTPTRLRRTRPDKSKGAIRPATA